MLHLNLPIAMILAYLVGSVSSAIIVCRLMGLPDPRQEGSQNPGATNVLRIGGKQAALLTLTGDFLKGFLPVFIAKLCGFIPFNLSLIALCAFLGHLYPIFFQFRGGKGVATLLGGAFGLSFFFGLALVSTWLTTAFFFRFSSLAAIVMAILAPLYASYFADPNSALVVIVMSVLLLIRHRVNIQKLITGAENRIGKK